MKNQLFILALLAAMSLFACQDTTTTAEASTQSEETQAPDYATYEKRVNLIRDFLKAHCAEDLDTQIGMLADTMRWSPPYYNGNQWLGKDEFVEALRGYHQTFDNIKFFEGIATAADTTAGGFWAGSVYSMDTPSGAPNGIRQYGTWTATHAESGKEIGLKWFALTFFNEDDKFISVSDYFDTASLFPPEE